MSSPLLLSYITYGHVVGHVKSTLQVITSEIEI